MGRGAEGNQIIVADHTFDSAWGGCPGSWCSHFTRMAENNHCRMRDPLVGSVRHDCL